MSEEENKNRPELIFKTITQESLKKKTQIHAEGENSSRCEIPKQILVKQPDLKSEKENRISAAPCKSRNSLNAKKIRLAPNSSKTTCKAQVAEEAGQPKATPSRRAWIPHGGREHCKGWMSLDPLTTANVDGRSENKSVYKVSNAL